MKLLHIRILCNKRGMSYVYTCVIILIFSMIISLIFSYASLITIISGVKDNSQRVLDGFCIEKSIIIYDSIKNGNKNMVSSEYTNEFMDRLSKELMLKTVDNSVNLWYNEGKKEDNVIYKFEKPLTANIDGDTLTLQTNFQIVIPISFIGISFQDIIIPITIKSTYNLK